MSAAEVWLTIFLLAVATILTRSSFYMLASMRLPARIQHALRYAPAAAMAAIVIPDLLLDGGAGGALAANWANPRLLAGLGASLFFLATRHLLATIVFGMALFTVVRHLF
jgi:branched-subunit amino acid transport protein